MLSELQREIREEEAGAKPLTKSAAIEEEKNAFTKELLNACNASAAQQEFHARDLNVMEASRAKIRMDSRFEAMLMTYLGGRKCFGSFLM